MKLELSNKPLEYKKLVLRETRFVEETAESIITDTCPDGESILFTSGAALLRGKDITEEAVNISVGVCATAMVRPEGRNEPEVIEVFIPMSLRVINEKIHTNHQCFVRTRLKRLDTFLVNPRKVMVKATVQIDLCLYEDVKEYHNCGCEQDGVQLLTETTPIRVLKAMGEKNYTVEDTVTSNDITDVRTICGYQVVLQHGDRRMAGSKAVLKGIAKIKLIYLNGEEQVKTTDISMDFSQYVDLGEYSEGEELELFSQLSGVDIESSEEGNGVRVVLQITTSAKLWGNENIESITDLYSLRDIAEFEKETFQYDSLLDKQSVDLSAGCAWEESAAAPIFLFSLASEYKQERNGEQVFFVVPVTVQGLFQDEDGELSGRTIRTEFKFSTVCCPGCHFELDYGEIKSSSVGGNVRLECEVLIKTFCIAEISEVLMGELRESEKSKGPGLIIVRPEIGQSLWDLAKKYGSEQGAIKSANHLEGDTLPDKMILIPRYR